jgi:hypothetical protein
MAYSFLTFSAAVQILSQRLQDSGLVYFNQPNQLLNCIIESARLYQALTFSYKQPLSFTTTSGQPYYSLTDTVLIPNSPLAYTVTDVEVINNVLAALLEPPLSGTGWSGGTGQFTFAQLQQSLQNRLNRFIGESGRQVAQQIVAGVAPDTELVTLPDQVLDVRRTGWVPTGGAGVYPLGRMDEWAEQAYIPNAAQNPAFPDAYSVYGVAPLQLRLIPPVSAAGAIDCIFVEAGVTVNLNPSAPVVLNIPDDVSAGLKWGVLADMLGTDGPSRDYTRADYCEQRYTEYVQLARIYPSVVAVTINGATAGWGSVFDLDFYNPTWEQGTGLPVFTGMCGRHLVCVGQIPDDGTAGGNPGSNYQIGFTSVANMPVPGDPTMTYLQVSRDWLDNVVDYAQHIASFQMAGAEFDGTTRLYQNMIAAAKAQNGRLEAIAFYKSQLEQPARKSEMEVDRMVA